jgi:hypothetical protein
VGFGWARLAAVGTGLLWGELVGLLLEEQLEGPFGQALCGRGGDLFHGSEVDVESGSVVAEGPFGDDFGPAGGKGAEFLEFLGCESR